jgi:hypothetical protein
MTQPAAGGDKVKQVDAKGKSGKPRRGTWPERLVLFLRVMAGVSMMKGLFHWAIVCGFVGAPDGFLEEPLAWRTATVFFAVIDLIAAVGLWLAAAWGAVVWLTASVSMVVVNVFFPQVYGEQITVIVLELVLIGSYLFLAIQAAREQPH